MKRIAICGNIASGKSTVQRIIEEFGYKVLDTDDVAHELLTVKNQKLFDTFKNLDVFENGEFSRTKLGKIVFSDIQLKEKLEKVVIPTNTDEIKEELERLDDNLRRLNDKEFNSLKRNKKFSLRRLFRKK